MTEEKLGYTGDPMVDRDLITIPEWERDYWETWNSVLPVPTGVVYDASSYVRWQKSEQELKAQRRMRNASMATGRVNGRFLKNGRPR